MDDKLKDKLLKLLELAERGVDGEKENAAMLLDKMLKKHGLTIEDINSELPSLKYYYYTSIVSKKIINQIIYTVTGSAKVYADKRNKCIYSEVTDYQHVQILEMVDFHLENYKEEREKLLDTFTSAYVHKHNLFPVNSDEKEEHEYTDADRQKALQILNLMRNLSDKTYTKKLTQ